MTHETLVKETEPLYCGTCKGCGEVGCDGIETFLAKHVRGKTDCLYEESYINDIIEIYKDNTTTATRVREETIEEMENYCKKQIGIQNHFLTEYEQAPFEWHRGRKIEAEEALHFLSTLKSKV